MKIDDYYRFALVPGNVALSAARRAGLPISRPRVEAQIAAWNAELTDLERFVEGVAAERGIALTYSEKHAPQRKPLLDLLFSAQGLGLPIEAVSKKTSEPSTDDSALLRWASLRNPRPDDHPVVTAILKIRSISKAKGTHLEKWLEVVRGDGALHPKFNWALRTARLSAEDPPVHQIPEHADEDVATKIKSCIVPRIAPAPSPEAWDPRVHGSCIRWDIEGAEAAVRMAMFTKKLLRQPDPVAYDYIRFGKDIHSKTAALIYGVPDGTYTKGSTERDVVGKQSTFAKLYGGTWTTMQASIREKARVFLEDAEAKRISDAWEAGYSGVMTLYERDKWHLGKYGYCEDAYGRRRWIALPPGARFLGWKNDKAEWRVDTGKDREAFKAAWWKLQNAFHIASNTPTQSTSAIDAYWMMAYLYLGEAELPPLAVPPIWAEDGVTWPEAAGWGLNEGPGPGGTPFLAWMSNQVHDSCWIDCAPGYVEPTAKLIWRRCRALPLDWRLETDVPYRVSISVGPDYGHVTDYKVVAARFGLEPLAA